MAVAPLAKAALDRLGGFLSIGPSLLIVTAGAGGVPEVCRCAAARLGADGVLRLAVPLPEGERSLANVAATGQIALTATRPSTYHGMQVKGREARVEDWSELAEAVETHARVFTAEAERMGVRGLIDLLWSKRFRCVAFAPDAIFEQTPGANAGLPVGA